MTLCLVREEDAFVLPHSPSERSSAKSSGRGRDGGREREREREGANGFGISVFGPSSSFDAADESKGGGGGGALSLCRASPAAPRRSVAGRCPLALARPVISFPAAEGEGRANTSRSFVPRGGEGG